MNPFLTHFGEEASGPAALGISAQAFVIQILTFLIVFLILKKWAFTPIIKMLNERRDVIAQGVTLGEKMRAEKTKLEERVSTLLHDARRQADTLLAEAETEVRSKVQAAEETARQRAQIIMDEASSKLKQDVERERKRLEKEIVNLVSDVSEAVIGQKVDATKDAALIDAALKERRS